MSGMGSGVGLPWTKNKGPIILRTDSAPGPFLKNPSRGHGPIGGEGGSGGGFPVNAVNFDGTNDYLARGAGLTGAADSKTGIFSCWVDRAADGGAPRIFAGAIDPGVNLVQISFASDAVAVVLRNSAGTVILNLRSTNTIKVVDGQTHILIAWDLATTTAKIFVDDVDVTDTPITITDDTIDYTITEWGGGTDGGPPGTNLFNGCIGQLYFQDGEFLDLTVVSNRRRFIDNFGNPVDLGADGSTPTGTQPIVFLTGATASWHTNKGSGGGFTEVGALSDCATSPND